MKASITVHITANSWNFAIFNSNCYGLIYMYPYNISRVDPELVMFDFWQVMLSFTKTGLQIETQNLFWCALNKAFLWPYIFILCNMLWMAFSLTYCMNKQARLVKFVISFWRKNGIKATEWMGLNLEFQLVIVKPLIVKAVHETF